jgi:hypothetical protein
MRECLHKVVSRQWTLSRIISLASLRPFHLLVLLLQLAALSLQGLDLLIELLDPGR